MFILSYKVSFKDIEEIITLLQINDIFNVFYESPLEITTDEFGYGYLEKEDEPIILKISYDNDDIYSFKEFQEKLYSILKNDPINVEEINYEYEEFKMPPIHINDSWVLADPSEEFEDKNKINFISQGAFGTGLHETTKDLLSLILSKEFDKKRVLDIGTGSGILSIATSIKGASEVVAIDLRDVEAEVSLNASLNNLNNITTLVGDVLSNEVTVDGMFDWIYINIGGEETKLFMPFIKEHLKPSGSLLVSGLVEWSFDSVNEEILKYGFKLEEKHQTNEWCTSIYSY